MKLILLTFTAYLTLLHCTPNIRQVIPEKNDSLSEALNLPNYGIGFFRIKTATLTTDSFYPTFHLDVREGIFPNFKNPNSISFELKKEQKGITKYIDDCGFLFANSAEYRIEGYTEHVCFGPGCRFYKPKIFTKRAFKIVDGEVSYYGSLSFSKDGNLVIKDTQDDKAFCTEKLKKIIPHLDPTKIKNRIMVKYYE